MAESDAPKTMNDDTQACEYVSANLERLMKHYGIKQQKLADTLGIKAANITDYRNKKRLPGTKILLDLKKAYGISIDDFLTKDISFSAQPDIPEPSFTIDEEALQKYCGTYFVYYLNNNMAKGNDSMFRRDSLVYGILHVYRGSSESGRPELRCAASLGNKNRDNVEKIRHALDEQKTDRKKLDLIGSISDASAYYGKITLSGQHIFVNMVHSDTDMLLMIFYRVDPNNKTEYIGGIGTVNSVSKGRQHMPAIQFIGTSRYRLSLSPEEIYYSLRLDYPVFKAEREAEELIDTFKKLYPKKSRDRKELSDFQKKLLIQSSLERYIAQSVERNMFRYEKISEDDDGNWYQKIKETSIHETD